MKTWVILLIAFFATAVAADLEISSPDGETSSVINLITPEVEFSNTTGTVNKSDFWDNLDTPSDISGNEFWYNQSLATQSMWNATWSETYNSTYHTFAQDIYVNESGDPDVNLTVHNVTANGDVSADGAGYFNDNLTVYVTDVSGNYGATPLESGLWIRNETGNPYFFLGLDQYGYSTIHSSSSQYYRINNNLIYYVSTSAFGLGTDKGHWFGSSTNDNNRIVTDSSTGYTLNIGVDNNPSGSYKRNSMHLAGVRGYLTLPDVGDQTNPTFWIWDNNSIGAVAFTHNLTDATIKTTVGEIVLQNNTIIDGKLKVNSHLNMSNKDIVNIDDVNINDDLLVRDDATITDRLYIKDTDHYIFEDATLSPNLYVQSNADIYFGDNVRVDDTLDAYKIGAATGQDHEHVAAEGTLSFNGGILISAEGSCPYLYTLSADNDGVPYYKWDNDFLSEIVGIQNERMDYIPVSLTPFNEGGYYKFRIKENDPTEEISYINYVQLYEVTYATGENFVITQSGVPFSYSSEIAPIAVMADDGEDITSAVTQRVEDHSSCQTWECRWFKDTPLDTFYNWWNETKPNDFNDATDPTPSGYSVAENREFGDWKATELTLTFDTPVKYLVVNADKCSYSVWIDNMLIPGKTEVEEVTLHERWMDNVIELPRAVTTVYIKREVDNPKISYIAGLTDSSVNSLSATVSALPIHTATNQDGYDISTIIETDDEVRYKLERGDHIDLTFVATLDPMPGMSKTYIMTGSGFYHGVTQHITGEDLNRMIP